MGHNHEHGSGESGKNLLIALALNVGITVAQVVGGLLSGSLALFADAAHNGSDAASIGIAYGARRIAQRNANPKYTFGYNRAEVIGALINLTTLFVIALFLMWQAVDRFINPRPIEGTTMLIVGGIAFIEDALSVWVLYRGQRQKMGVKAVMIHLVGDTLATLGVIVGALLIMFYGITWIDPAITAAIAVYIVVHASLEIRKSIRLLMDTAPEDFEFDRMVREVEALDGVEDLHHVHLWRLDEERVALEAHVVVAERDLREIEAIKRRIKDKLNSDFEVEHATLEIEIAGRTDHVPSVIREGE